MPDAKPYRPLRWLFLSALVLALDFVSKQLMLHYLHPYDPYPVIPGFFNLTLAFNRGVAFSLFDTSIPWVQTVLSVVAIVIIILLFIWLGRSKRQSRWVTAGIAMILGGAIGNVSDRLTTGSVIDFLQFFYHTYAYPAFNVADIAITLGVICLLMGWWKQPKTEAPTP